MAFEKPQVDKRPISEDRMRQINYLIGKGYGWSKYALSVKEQGWISQRQEATISQMYIHVSNFTFQSSENVLDYSEAVDYGGVGPTW